MTQKIFLCSLVMGVCLLGCFNTPQKVNNIISENTESEKDTILSKEDIYKKIEEIVDQTIKNRKKNKLDYSTEKYLNHYFSLLTPSELIKDDKFKAITGRLLEYSYLEARDSGEFPPESFPIYNMSLIIISHSHRFILNIITDNSDIKKHIDKKTYEIYSTVGTDFVCIDSIVLALDKIPQMQNDSIHKICIDLVKRNKTGGCKW